jgi:hypothetical protein
MMKSKELFALILLIAPFVVKAQTNISTDQEYVATVTKRADKILATLQIADSAEYKAVRQIIVEQYVALNNFHEQQKTGSTNASTLYEMHQVYIKALSGKLNAEQVGQIKNGMTYNVLPVTYKAYNDMIPSLKAEEKLQIMNWLTEARELAMDAGSSEEKHAVFGKYKGRINNYLSGHGYNLQEERKNWEERMKVSKTKGK